MKYSRDNLITLAARLKMLGIDEPGIWVGGKGEGGGIFMRYVPITKLTEEQARRNWGEIQDNTARLLKKHTNRK